MIAPRTVTVVALLGAAIAGCAVTATPQPGVGAANYFEPFGHRASKQTPQTEHLTWGAPEQLKQCDRFAGQIPRVVFRGSRCALDFSR